MSQCDSVTLFEDKLPNCNAAVGCATASNQTATSRYGNQLKLCSVMPLQACQTLPLTAGYQALDVHFSSWTSCWQSAQPHGTQRTFHIWLSRSHFRDTIVSTKHRFVAVALASPNRSVVVNSCEQMRFAAVTLVLCETGSLDAIRYSSDQSIGCNFAPRRTAHFLFRLCNSGPAALQPARRLRLHAFR